jgi:hypothetical protein
VQCAKQPNRLDDRPVEFDDRRIMNAALNLIHRPASRRKTPVMASFLLVLSLAMADASAAGVAEERPDVTPPARVTPSYAASATTPESGPSYVPPEEPRRPWFGGLGYVSIAPFFGDLSALESGLRAPEALGESYGHGAGALLLGGGGGAVLFGHLWLGGNGFGLLTSSFHNARGDARLSGGGGAFELGYVLSTNAKMLIIPFFGLGGFAYNLEVTNNTNQPMPLLNAFSIAHGESKTFTAGFTMLEAGIRLQRLLFSRNGGMSAGFEVGVLRSLSDGPWLSGHSEFTHEEGARLDGVYARINIGGAGFVFR